MCGIVGMLVRDGLTAEDRAEVAALTDLMVRRGPDDSGSWDDGRACALGFRRLAIIDLTAGGHQPMVSEDGEHVLVFNGEVYNFRQLRSELEAAGRRFVTARHDYGAVAYGWAMEDSNHFVKLIADPDTGQLLGAHILGPQATVLIQPLIQAMSFDLDVPSMARGQYWIHPALTEVVENALLALEP